MNVPDACNVHFLIFPGEDAHLLCCEIVRPEVFLVDYVKNSLSAILSVLVVV